MANLGWDAAATLGQCTFAVYDRDDFRLTPHASAILGPQKRVQAVLMAHSRGELALGITPRQMTLAEVAGKAGLTRSAAKCPLSRLKSAGRATGGRGQFAYVAARLEEDWWRLSRWLATHLDGTAEVAARNPAMNGQEATRGIPLAIRE